MYPVRMYHAREHIIMLEVNNRLRSRTRVTSFMFQTALSLKNRLRSRTRVTTVMFRSALSLKNRLRSVEGISVSRNDQIRVRCSRAKKCSQMIEIDYFCLCVFQPT